jgi:hypothetical protein
VTKNEGVSDNIKIRVHEPLDISAGYRSNEEKTEIEQLKASKLTL